MKIIEKFDRQFEFAGILMNVFIAFQFFILWKQPQLTDLTKIATLSILMLFEFVMVHSGVFMSVMPRKISVFVLIPFYGLFALGFNALVDDHLILVSYLLVIFNRMRFAFSDVSKTIKNRSITKSVLAAVIYFVLLFVTLMAAGFIPKMGLNETFIKTSGYGISNHKEGIFTEFPHAAMAFGVLYYCSLALMEALFLNRKFEGTSLVPHTINQ